MITIYEYLEYRNASILHKLERLFGWRRWVLKLDESFRTWQAVMEEPPKPGLAGILAEEEKARVAGCGSGLLT